MLTYTTSLGTTIFFQNRDNRLSEFDKRNVDTGPHCKNLPRRVERRKEMKMNRQVFFPVSKPLARICAVLGTDPDRIIRRSVG